METIKLDHVALNAITNKTHTSTVTMLLLALRARDRDTTNLNAMKDKLIRMGEKVVEEHYEAFWQGLHEAGVGTFVRGRRGRPDRFKWNYSIKVVARAAIEGREELVKVLNERNTVRKAKQVTRQTKPRVKRTYNKKSLNGSVAKKRLYSVSLSNGRMVDIIIDGIASSADMRKIKSALSG